MNSSVNSTRCTVHMNSKFITVHVPSFDGRTSRTTDRKLNTRVGFSGTFSVWIPSVGMSVPGMNSVPEDPRDERSRGG